MITTRPRSGGPRLTSSQLRRAVARRGPSRLAWWGVVLCAGLMGVGAALRLACLPSGYDVISDEVVYVDLGRSSAHGHFPPLFEHGPFLLHPPLMMLMWGGWDLIWGVPGKYLHMVGQARALNLVLAVITIGLLYAIGTRLAGRAAGAATALLFAVDPYVLRQNGKAMLETGTVMWVLIGVLILMPLLSGRARHRLLTAAAGGGALGLAIVGNDIAVVLTTVPLVFATWRGWGGPRRHTAVALVATSVPYAAFLVALAVVGHLGSFVSQQWLGIERILGLVQSTGFNRRGSPSLLHTMLIQASRFGVTYLLCAAGVLAGIYLLARHPHPAVRYMATITVCGIATLTYAVAIGTIEEQFLYYLYVPALVALPVAVRLWMARRASIHAGHAPARRQTKAWARLAVVALAAFVAYDVSVAVQVATVPDNGQQRLINWLSRHPSDRGVVANDTQTTTFLLQRSGIAATTLTTPAAAAAEHVRYITLLAAEEDGGYTDISKADLAFFKSHGQPVFSFDERTYGTMTVWRTTDPGAW